MYLGSDVAGSRVPKLYKENVDEAGVLSEIDALTARWSAERTAGEGFGDFVIRVGIVEQVIVSFRDFHHA